MLSSERIGTRYPEQRFEVTAQAIRAFAAACNDENPRYLDDDFDRDGMVAPPLFAVVAAAPSELQPLTDEKLTGPASEFFRRMVRGDNELIWSERIRPGDTLASTAVVAGIDERPNGELLRVEITLRKGAKEVARVNSGYFVRGEGGGRKTADGPKAGEPSRGPVVAAVDMAVAADQPLRYAEASGDRNPIHTDPEVAKLYGHPGVILQGSCTMAFVAKAVLDTFCGGDPRKLHRLRVRYARPVLPGDVVTTIFWRQDEGSLTQLYGLEAKKQDGTVVIKNAFAEVSKSEVTATKELPR